MSQLDPSPLSPSRKSSPAARNDKAYGRRSLTSRFLGWLVNDPSIVERRRCPRVPSPPLRAYLGVIGSTQAMPVGNISSTGFYLHTDDHWIPGTNIPLRLERTDKPGFDFLHCVTVSACVVRTGSDGVGFAFVRGKTPATPQTRLDESEGAWHSARWADKSAIEELLAELSGDSATGR